MNQLDTIPIPVDATGEPAQAVVVHDGTWRLAWQLGRQKHPTELTYRRPRDAAKAASYLNERSAR